jgi:hypothetical protein
MNAIRPSHCGMARRSSTQTRQFAIGRFDMLGILEMLSVVNFPQPLPRNPRCGAQPMRLGMAQPNPANSLFRRMISLFGPKNSLFSFEQGIRPQAVDPSSNLCADWKQKPAKTDRNLTNSLLISLLSGNLRPRLVRMPSFARLPGTPASLRHVPITSARRVGKGALFAPCPPGCGIGGHASLCPPYGAWISSERALAPSVGGLRSSVPRRRALSGA